MVLDSNLYTLHFFPRPAPEHRTIDLKESGTNAESYTSTREEDGGIHLQDTLSGATLATCSNVAPKTRLIQLFNPNQSVEFKSTGIIQLEWTFKYESESYLLKRDILGVGSGDKGYSLWMDRNPDPNWCIALYRPRTKKGPANLQILDYNLDRIFIEDKRGLEIIIIAALCTMDNVHSSSNDIDSRDGAPIQETLDGDGDTRKSIDPIPIEDFETDEYNLVVVSERGDTDSYVNRCLHLLSDPAILFIQIRSRESGDGASVALAVAKVVKVASLVKTSRWKNEGEDLKQYTITDEQNQLPHKRVHILDAPSNDPTQYRPPRSLSIYLSRTDLDELLPKPSSQPFSAAAFNPTPSISSSSKHTSVSRPNKTKKDKEEGVKLNFWGRRKS